jgi:hypothetical protein
MDAPKDLELMHKRVVFSILQYLNGLTQGGAAVPAGLDKEGLEVAVQCIASAFGVDPANSEHQSQFAVPFQLTDIYNYGLLHLAQVRMLSLYSKSRTWLIRLHPRTSDCSKFIH